MQGSLNDMEARVADLSAELAQQAERVTALKFQATPPSKLSNLCVLMTTRGGSEIIEDMHARLQ